MIKNYRPISLTNYDYKIIAFTISNRLQKVLPSLIHQNQTAYIKKKFIGDNVRVVNDIIEYSEKYKKPAIIFGFLKAINTVEWNFTNKVLQKLNFGENVISWIKILYEKANVVIKTMAFCQRKSSLKEACIRDVRYRLSFLYYVLTF